MTWADEIVVADSSSHDKTVEICRKYTDKIFQRKWPRHRDQYQYAADLTTHEWVMFVDADEEVSSKLAKDIRETLNGGAEGVDGFFVYRRTHYLGRWIRYGGWYPDGEIWLYRRGERPIAQRIPNYIGEGGVGLTGRTHLLRPAALLERCQLLVTNDTGMMHVAMAVGTPVAVIFGSTDPQTTGPWGDGHVIIKKDVPCSPCLKINENSILSTSSKMIMEESKGRGE